MPLGADRQQLSIDVEIDGCRIDAGHIGTQDVLIAVAEEIHRHQSRSSSSVEDAGGEAVELAQSIERVGHDLSPFVIERAAAGPFLF